MNENPKEPRCLTVPPEVAKRLEEIAARKIMRLKQLGLLRVGVRLPKGIMKLL